MTKIQGASAVTEAQQELDPGAIVELYMLDLSAIGEDTQFYFARDPGVSYDGQAYAQMPVHVTDVERNATGEQISPRLSIPNTTKFAAALVSQYDDLVGAEITRTVTLQRFLDGEAAEDGDAYLSRDLFIIEQKLNLNGAYGEWELRSRGDTADRTFPGRVAMKKICPFIYRRWDPVNLVFVESKVRPCPYTNTTYMFTKENVATVDPALDACDNKVAGGCLARKPGWPNGYLKFGGYPGINRYRVG